MRHASSSRWLKPLRAALGLAHTQQRRSSNLALVRLEDRTVPASMAIAPAAVVDRGDFYTHGEENIGLLQRVGEYAIQLTPSANIRAVTAKGLFAGFQVEKQLEDNIFILRSETGAMPSGPSSSGIAWISPLFQSKEFGSWLVASDEIIVALNDGVTPEQFFTGNALFTGYRRLSGSPNQFVGTLTGGAGRNALAISEALNADRRVDWAAPNFYQDWQKHFVPNDALFAQQWHLRNTGQTGGVINADVDAELAWDVIQGGSPNINIAVVDDCMEIAHPDLAPNIFINTGEIPGNTIDDDGNGYVDDTNGWDFTEDTGNLVPSPNDAHATAVGGIAAARGENTIGVAGIAYLSKIVPVRIFGDSGGATNDANIASAVYYSAGRTADGAGTFRSGDIMNNSWGGGGPSTAITAAFTWASTLGRGGKGVVSFISSGNGGSSSIAYPSRLAGSLTGVLSIGSSNDLQVRSGYSQYGPELDVLAPSDGGNAGTTTTDRVGSNGYNPAPGAAGNYTGGFGGTSSASPLAAGVGALILARDPNLTASQVRGLMRNTTDLIDPTNAAYDASSGFSLKYGYGKTNAFTAVSGVGIAKGQVLRGSSVVASGTGSVAFGTVVVGAFADVTLRLRNQGTETLNLTGLNISAGSFSAASGFTSTAVGVGQSTTFTLRFSPTGAPAANATITITSNDATTPNYTFTLNGQGVQPSIAGTIFEDWSANSVRDLNDPGLVNAVAFLDSNGNGTRDLLQNTYDSTDVPKTIPDDDPGGATSVINITDVGQIDSLTVTLSLTHTWVSDLVATLTSPSGRQIQLFANVGDDGDDFAGTIFDDAAAAPIASGTAPFTGSFRPDQPLSTFVGDSANGVWRLKIVDQFFLDEGAITAWSIQMTTSESFATSDSNGFYAFVGLPAATYTVSQDSRAGFRETGPATDYTVNLPVNGTVIGRDFGQNRKNAIYGVQFGDANSNGIKDVGDPLLPGWKVYHDTNNNGNFDVIPNLFSASDVPLSIPDLGAAVSTIDVNGLGGDIAGVRVTLSIAHTYDEDLTATLIGPDGTRVTLFDRVGGTGQNFTDTTFDDNATTPIASGTAPFTGTFRPQQALSALANKPVNGEWKLEVQDNFPGDTGNIFEWSLSLDSTEPFEITDSRGNYRFDTLAPATYVLREIPQAGFVQTAPTGGAYSVVLAADATVVDRDFGVHTDVAPTVQSVVVGDGTSQRSRIEQLKVTFGSQVNFASTPAAAFQLEKIVGGVPAGTVGVAVTTAVVAGRTEATITFTSDTQFGSLVDGRYRLTILASQVTNAGTPLAADHVTNFHRYFGDSNNDTRVDIADFGSFSGTFGRNSTQSGYLSYYDFNNDARIDIVDFGQFSLRFFVPLP